MKGQLHIIYPDKPIEVRFVSHPVPFEEIQRIVGGTLEVVQHWDHHINYGGALVPALVLCNEDAAMTAGRFNLHATAIWHFISRTKGIKLTESLTGPVVVCMGDQEFLESVLD